MRNPRNTQSGFSVIEVAVISLVAGVLVATSVIAFGKARATYELKGKAESIARQIERARSLAIRYNQTMTMAFTSQNTTLGLTCTDCDAAKAELPSMNIPYGLTLSSFPNMTINSNGTIETSSSSITINDGNGRQVVIAISNAGRVGVSDVTDAVTR
jgi:type II secretion system GspH-like protein